MAIALIRTRCIALYGLPASALEELSQRLYTLHCHIFSGVSYEAFRNYVVFSPAWRTWIYIRYVRTTGEWVGYTALHAFHKHVLGRPAVVFRLEMGALQAYRGRDLTLTRTLGRMLRVSLRHWSWAPYLFSSFIYPASYALAARYAPVIWPNQHRPTPPHYEQLLHTLAEEFNLAPVAPGQPLVRLINWITREISPPAWDTRRNSHIAHFLRLNPTYFRGHGLLTIMPVKPLYLVQSLVRFVYGRGTRLLRQWYYRRDT